MRKIAVLLITLTFLVTTLFSMSFSSAAASHDYATALKYSILFYDANKCGPDAAVDNVFSWRGPCHTTDGSEIGLDLTGGYHDAGDHVKFGLPQAYAAAYWVGHFMNTKECLTQQETPPKCSALSNISPTIF